MALPLPPFCDEIPLMKCFEAYEPFTTPIDLNDEADLKAVQSHAHEDKTIHNDKD
jgi:hypothetical protein